MSKKSTLKDSQTDWESLEKMKDEDSIVDLSVSNDTDYIKLKIENFKLT